MMSPQDFRSQYRVYIEDTDAGGVVYYVNYLKYMERARTDFLRELGFPKPALLNEALAIVVSSAQIDYRRSAQLDDLLIVTAKPLKMARTYMVFAQTVYRESASGAELLAEGEIKVACVRRDTGRPAAFPADVKHAVEQQLEQLETAKG